LILIFPKTSIKGSRNWSFKKSSWNSMMHCYFHKPLLPERHTGFVWNYWSATRQGGSHDEFWGSAFSIRQKKAIQIVNFFFWKMIPKTLQNFQFNKKNSSSSSSRLFHTKYKSTSSSENKLILPTSLVYGVRNP